MKAYKREETGALISQTVIMPLEDGVGSHPVSLEFHNLAETGETYVIVRTTEKKS